MTSKQNSDPTVPIPEVQFTDPEIRILDDFTDGLRRAHYDSQGNEQAYEQSVEKVIQEGAASTNNTQGVGSESLRLAVAAESLGATPKSTYLSTYYDVLHLNPLLSDEDKTLLIGVVDTFWWARRQNIPDEEIAPMVTAQVVGILDIVDHGPDPDLKREGLKLGALAFLAGATNRLPQYPSAEHLMQEAQALRKVAA